MGEIENFGHEATRIVSPADAKGNRWVAFIDAWGAGPFSLRVGRKRYYFTDCDMFGPLLESKDGRVLDKQPGERAAFWPAYSMWRALGRKGRKVGKMTVCRWRMPRAGKYWKDSRGVSHFICDPEFDGLGYQQIPAPEARHG